jgi:hypothetical protein
MSELLIVISKQNFKFKKSRQVLLLVFPVAGFLCAKNIHSFGSPDFLFILGEMLHESPLYTQPDCTWYVEHTGLHQKINTNCIESLIFLAFLMIPYILNTQLEHL